MSDSVREVRFDLGPVAPPPAPPTASLFRTLPRRKGWIIAREAIFRLAGLCATACFAVGAAAAFVSNPSRISLLALLLGESLVLVLLLFSAVPKRRDWRPSSIITSWFVCIYPVLVNVEPGVNLAPWQVTGVLGLLGLGLNTWAKLNLGASFAILPGVRTIVATGPYRFIRHPVYAGFGVTCVSFLLNDFSLHNLALLSTVFGCELYRVGREEALLGQDQVYRDYCQGVRYRFIPGVV